MLALYVHARKRFDGQVTLAFLGYAVLRFLVEVVCDADRGALLGRSTSQLIGVAILAVVAASWIKLAPRSNAPVV